MAPGRHVAGEYKKDGLLAAILEAQGTRGTVLTPAQLAPVDEFHVRGRRATEDLAAMARLQADDLVLDAGCGLGGSARCLAAERGVRVVGIDLSEDYVMAGAALNTLTGLAHRVTLCHGSVTDLPFARGAFDVVWTQHVQMNVADKSRMYAEFARALRPGGRLVLHDLLAGEGPPVFPVPWARAPGGSHLVTPEELRALIVGAGFDMEEWRDTSAEGVEAVAGAAPRASDPAEPASLRVLQGDEAGTRLDNLARNLATGRVRAVIALARRT